MILPGALSAACRISFADPAANLHRPDMRVRFPELQRHLDKGLAPIYLLSGDEPLQVSEAADAIRNHARSRGYATRDVLEADNKFDWNQLAAEANSLSLFSEQRIIDLRLPSGKPGREGASALVEYAERPPEDTLLLLTLPKLEKSQANTKWFKTLDKVGVVIQIWPIEGERLQPWIEQRMRKAGLTPAGDVVPMLAERIEGNLLAASQEIDKLLLIHGPGVIDAQQLAESVTDSARYDVFTLVDSALEGQVSRCLRILNGLQAEGTPAPVVLWALTREIRMLCNLAAEHENGRSIQQAIAANRGIWDKRKPLVAKGLKRLSLRRWQALLRTCGQADRAIKGQEKSEPWLLMQQITTTMAGAPAIGRG
ncbi:MAG: DNA polymerase III subunit delta [Sedimenticola sp.]